MLRLLRSKYLTLFLCTIFFGAFQLLPGKAAAQTVDSVYWDFGTTAAPLLNATFSSNISVSAANCVADTGNGLGLTVAGLYLGVLHTNFNSATWTGHYPNASGGLNITNNCKPSPYNASTSTYISFIVVPAAGVPVTITGVSFGVLVGTGNASASYDVATSVDGFASVIGSGSILSGNYGGAKKVFSGLSITGAPGVPIVVRVYIVGLTAASTGGNLSLDDMTINYSVPAGAPSITTNSLASNSLCAGADVMVPYTTSGLFVNGNTFTAQLSDASGSFAAPVTIGILGGVGTGIIAATIPAGTPAGTGYRIRVIADNPAATGTDNGTDISINTSFTPSVIIAANPGATICAGTPVTFTATPTNGGGGPSYQWKKNGATVGTTNATYTDNGLVNGDAITVVLTSNATCAVPATANSNTITMTVNAVVTPSVSITANPGTTICAGTPVTFTGAPTNGGLAPSYQWKKNGVVVGTTSATYTDNVLNNGDVITTVLTSNAACATPNIANATPITMTVNAAPTVTVGGPTTTCAGAPVVLTASGANTYTWAPGASLSATTGTTVTATPTATTTYTITGTGVNGCMGNTTYTVNVNTSLTSLTITPSSASICSGSSATLVSNVVGVTTALTQDFNASPATGWTVAFTGSPNSQFQIRSYGFATGGTTIHSADGTSFFEADGTAGGSGAKSTTLTSPVFSLAGLSSATFSFDSWYDHSSSDSYAGAEITTNGGATWTSIISATINGYNGVQTLSNYSVSLNSYLGNANVQVRFRYTSTFGYAWAVDNAKVQGTPQPMWSPAATLFTNPGLSMPYSAGATAGTVYAAPVAATTIYTATVGNCLATATATVTVNPLLVPSASIVAVPGDTICAGTSVTFTASSVNGGNAPSYQWKKNGVSVGVPAPTYTDNALNDGDAITTILTSNALCATPATISADTIKMKVNPILTPSATITADPGTTICAGIAVTFTANPLNGGDAPSYQWTKNGAPVGTTDATYIDNTLNNGDVIATTLTSNATCAVPAIVNADPLTMTVNPILVPVVTVAATPGDTICAGTPVTFIATPVNGGNAPSYQWMKNGNAIGTPADTYSDNGLVDGDIITAILTSNAACTIPDTAIVADTIKVNPILVPAATIAADPGATICAGTQVIFTATPVNGGDAPSYQWTKNGNTVGTTDATYTDNTLNNGDLISAILTSNAVCVIPATANADTITMIVNPTVIPDVTIAVAPGDTICAGTPVTFTATAVNGGNTPSYQWRKNGNPVGAPGDTYTDNGLNNSDIITAVLTSNATCAIPDTAVAADTMTVNLMVTPQVTATANPGDTICAGSPVTITATATDGGNNPVYTWIKNGAAVGSGDTYTDNGIVNNDNIVCKLTSDATCTAVDSASDTLNFVVHALPTPVITKVGDVLGTGAYTSYQWYMNGVAIPGSTTVHYVAPVAGDYTVVVTDSNGCSGTSAVQQMFNLGVNTVTGANDVQLYPNPNNGVFTLEGTIDSKEASLEIINAVGQVVYRKQINSNNGYIKEQVSMDDKATGMYLLKLNSGNSTKVIKFVTKM